jgi:hypothetical protein
MRRTKTTTTKTTTTLTIRFLTLGLAVAATACRSTPAHAQPVTAAEPLVAADPLAAEPQSSPPPTSAARPAQNPNDPHATTQNAVLPPTRSKTVDGALMRGRLAAPRQTSTFDAYGRALGQFSAVSRGSSSSAAAAESPVAVVSTEPMDAATGDEWREDLVVMDKLLRDAVSGASSVAEMQRVVLGLAIKQSASRVAPTYVEGAGVVFTTGAAFPLAPDANATSRPDRPRQPPSAWERAKREINGDPRPGARWGSDDFGGEMGVEDTPRVEFEQAKVDALVDSIVKVLPEATNFRHLKGGEHVFVSVVGYGESGAPARLTLKAKKADIDAASRGAITPEEFKSRVATRVVSRVSTAAQSSGGNAAVPGASHRPK